MMHFSSVFPKIMRWRGELIPKINNPFTSALRAGQTHARLGNGTVSGNSTKK